MHSTARLVAASIAALTVTVLAAPAPATAALPMISAGDRVDYINPKANNQFCTIGYAYTGPDFHTYAVTAGHCGNSDSGYVRDAQTKLTGNVVRAVVSSPRYGGPDYGLIDFGKYSVASVFIGEVGQGLWGIARQRARVAAWRGVWRVWQRSGSSQAEMTSSNSGLVAAAMLRFSPLILCGVLTCVDVVVHMWCKTGLV